MGAVEFEDGATGSRRAGAEAFAPSRGSFIANDLHKDVLTPREPHRRALERRVQRVVQQVSMNLYDLHGLR